MKVVLAGIGRMKAGPERELLRRYLDRAEAAQRSAGLTGVVAIELEESRARSAEQRKRDEAAALEQRLAPGSAVMILDEGGSALTSEQIATHLARLRDAGTPAAVFAIGGPDGWDPAFRGKHRTLAFGAATFPHQLVRVLMAEQIYRAVTILSGHPYHRA